MTSTYPTISQEPLKISYKILLLGVLIFFFDQLTKGMVYFFLPVIDSSFNLYPYGGIGIFQNIVGIEFSINHMTNTGAAWGVLANYQFPLILLRIGLIVGLSIYLFYFNQHASWQIPLILVISGATGNVFDFFIYGHVVDMLHFVFWGYDFPVFNLADSAITLGITSLFFLSWFEF